MATIDVKDAAGATVAIEKPLVPGRTAAATSRPVALSTEDKAALDALATQTTLAAVLATAGATTGAAVITDANGTIQQYLRGLVKRWADALGAGTAAAALRTTSASDDPAVATLGAVADAAATQGSTGSISAKLRTITAQLNTLGAPTDAKSTATDTTSASAISIWKQISASVQLSVFGAGTAAAAQRVTHASDDPVVAALTTLDGRVDGLETLITSTNTKLDTAITALQVIDNMVLAAGTAAIGKLAANSGVDIGDVDVLTVPADPFGVNADAASATGSISAKLRSIAATGIPITGTVTVATHAVTGSGNFASSVADGADVTLGAKADAKSTATDTTAITAMSVWKQISASAQSLVSGILALGRGATAASLSVVEASDREITITFTPSCFAGALAVGDVVFATEEIANVVLVNGAQFELASIQASDISDLGAAIDLYFFNANTSLGAEDAAPDIDDTEVLTVIKGPVRILAADWIDLGANRVATIDNLGLKMKAGAATTSTWLAGVTQTAVTFAAGTLQLQLTFVRK